MDGLQVSAVGGEIQLVGSFGPPLLGQWQGLYFTHPWRARPKFDSAVNVDTA